MKFKIGDRVRVALKYCEHLTGIVVSSQDKDGMYVINMKGFGRFPLNRYKRLFSNLDFLEGDFSECGWVEEYDIIPLTVPDSKLARRLYKNQILKIEDDKIFLKG